MNSNGFGQGFSNIVGYDGFGSGFVQTNVDLITTLSGLKLYLDSGNRMSYPGTGNTWYDISGNQKNATLYNSPTYNSNNGGILNFASANYQYASGPQLGSLTTWTAEAWVKYSSTPSAGTTAIITDQYDLIGNLNFSLGTNEPLSSTVRAGFFNGAWRNTTPGLTVTTGVWYHIVGTYNGSTVTLYVNKNVTGTLNYVGTPASGGLSYRVARRWDAADNDSGNFTNGSIPIVRVYNRAISASEISDNFEVERSRFGI
jgi:hypothetical protein